MVGLLLIGIVMTVKQRQEFRIALQKRARRMAEKKIELHEEERLAKDVSHMICLQGRRQKELGRESRLIGGCIKSNCIFLSFKGKSEVLHHSSSVLMDVTPFTWKALVQGVLLGSYNSRSLNFI